MASNRYSALFTNCIAYYDFSKDAKELINGYDGTVSGATLTTDRFGIPNHAYTFNGSSAKIQNPSILTIGTSSVSVAFWMKTNNSTATNMPVCGWRTAIGDYPMFIAWIADVASTFSGNSTKLVVGNRQNNSYYINVKSNTDVVTGEWVFVVMTRTATSTKIYINGVLDNSATGTSVNIPAISYFYIGYSDTVYYTGTLGEHFVFTEDISADKVKLLYDLTKQKYIYPFMKGESSDI